MIALYLRLSMADGDLGRDGKDESNSVEHQRAILRDYVRRKDDISGEIEEYIDDGYSGTNFNRPAFKNMLEDMKRGRINTVLTKDLSRLGRNYIEVGDYMDQIFPRLGVRYIAVNSNYDSNNYIGSTSGLDMSFMNLVNSLYSKDLSKKYRSAVETRWKNGKSTSGRTPLGYMRDPNNRGCWLIEPAGCEIVRKIYDMVNEGLDMKGITERLNEEGVPTPGQYRESIGDVKTVSRKVTDKEWLWDTNKVRKVLQTYEYTGALVQQKMKTIIVGSGSRRTVPEDERFVTENHHEPIVTMAEYEKGQNLFRKSQKGPIVNSCKYPLGFITYCGNCGLSLVYVENANGTFMKCRHKEMVGSASECPETLYPTELIDSAVMSALKTQMFELELLKIKLSSPRPDKSNTSQSSKVENEIRSLQVEKTRAYEAYAEGRLSKNEYLTKRDRIKNRLERLAEKKAETVFPGGTNSDMCDKADQLAALMKELSSGREISQEMIDAFIEKVYVHDINHIEVVFKFGNLLEQMAEAARKEAIA